MSVVEIKGAGKNNILSNQEIKELYHKLDNLEENTGKMVINDSDAHNVAMPEKIEVDEDSMLFPRNDVITRKDGSETPVVDTIKPKTEHYEEALKPYGFSDEEAKEFMQVLSDYNRGVRTGFYERFPQEAKNIVDNMISMSKAQGQRISRDNAINMVLDSFVNDAKFNAAFDEYQEDMNETLSSVNTQLSVLIKESIDDIRHMLPAIREESPEKAEQLDAILKAFDQAKTFDLQRECLKKYKTKKQLMKVANRIKNECFYFNKKVNSSDFDIKVPDIYRIIPVLQNACMEHEDEVLACFVVLICESITKVDMTKLENVAYFYRMISDLVSYEYSLDFSSDEAKELFGNIDTILVEIEQLK